MSSLRIFSLWLLLASTASGVELYQSILDKHDKIPDVDLPNYALVAENSFYERQDDRKQCPRVEKIKEVAEAKADLPQIMLNIESLSSDENGTKWEKARRIYWLYKAYAPAGQQVGWYAGWGIDYGYGGTRPKAEVEKIMEQYREQFVGFDAIGVDIYNYYSEQGPEKYEERMEWRLEQMKSLGIPLVVYVTPTWPRSPKYTMAPVEEVFTARQLALKYGDAMVLWASSWSENDTPMEPGAWQVLFTKPAK